MFKISFLSAVVLTTCLCIPAQACSTPVFQYALERWPPDPYPLFVFHRGDLSEKDEELLARIEDATSRQGSPNLSVEKMDLREELPQLLMEIWDAQERTETPWAVLMYPNPYRNPLPVFAGEVEDVPVNALIDSPKRRQIAEHILNGDVAVWVLLESGNAEKDQQAGKRLGDILDQLEKELRIPDWMNAGYSEPDTDEEDSGKVELPLLTLSRNNPEEAMLVKMLLNSEPDLTDFEEPIAFPVYGRGRALYAFVGEGINIDTIGRACAFLINGCSCQIKAQNPGTDLIMAIDWDQQLADTTIVRDVSLPPLAGVTEPTQEENEDNPEKEIESGSGQAAGDIDRQAAAAPARHPSSEDPPETPYGALMRNVAVAVLIGLGAIAAGTIIVLRRTAR